MKDTRSLVFKDMECSVGQIRLIASEVGLTAILWEGEGYGRTKISTPERDDDSAILLETEKQLKEYFNKTRTSFDLPLDLSGTEFQKKIWQVLQTIPFGTTKTYGEVAQITGDINATRAVGGALNKNPVSIVIPCHRVVGASGKLGGFAGGSENKLILLELENTNRTYDLFSKQNING